MHIVQFILLVDFSNLFWRVLSVYLINFAKKMGNSFILVIRKKVLRGLKRNIQELDKKIDELFTKFSLVDTI